MYEGLRERCERAFEDYIKGLYDLKPDEFGMIEARTPWDDDHCIFRPGIPALIDQIRAALDAQVWFAKHGPYWAQPLPLAMKDICPMLRGSGQHCLLGYYALSLYELDYDYVTHPQIYEFCRGVMFKPPERLRDSPHLLTEFPPKELPGLGSRWGWMPPKQGCALAG